jgi:hypothetical protein
VALLTIVMVDDGTPEPAAVPPVEETRLSTAATRAGCVLRRVEFGERLNPSVSGPTAASPAPPGLYDDAPDALELVAALRRGIIVIQFRPTLDEARIAELRGIQAAFPTGTIVTPNDTAMPYEVAAAGYGRLLGCSRVTDTALDAVQLFRGRFVGMGPDA